MTASADSSVPTKILSYDHTFSVFFFIFSFYYVYKKWRIYKCIRMKIFFTFYNNSLKN